MLKFNREYPASIYPDKIVYAVNTKRPLFPYDIRALHGVDVEELLLKEIQVELKL